MSWSSVRWTVSDRRRLGLCDALHSSGFVVTRLGLLPTGSGRRRPRRFERLLRLELLLLLLLLVDRSDRMLPALDGRLFASRVTPKNESKLPCCVIFLVTIIDGGGSSGTMVAVVAVAMGGGCESVVTSASRTMSDGIGSVSAPPPREHRRGRAFSSTNSISTMESAAPFACATNGQQRRISVHKVSSTLYCFLRANPTMRLRQNPQFELVRSSARSKHSVHKWREQHGSWIGLRSTSRHSGHWNFTGSMSVPSSSLSSSTGTGFTGDGGGFFEGRGADTVVVAGGARLLLRGELAERARREEIVGGIFE